MILEKIREKPAHYTTTCKVKDFVWTLSQDLELNITALMRFSNDLLTASDKGPVSVLKTLDYKVYRGNLFVVSGSKYICFDFTL